ncbi:hypothetical protein F5Y16DRAFT_413920 [Xylariaceae sp. FL0255]|nr:hypothetical protein F5Y16DRAFT_413920 [Xylariaceae sp. FL0255]
MMLTLKQPLPYGYRPLHDLPTPPRSSPPVTILDSLPKQPAALPPHQSPPTQPMSGSHRGLPLPAAMTLAQPPPPPGPPHPPAPSAALQSQPAPSLSSHSHGLGPLPPPPQWQGAEDSMRHWLLTKAEEERRRQEEERSLQENLRLEQRKIEREIFFASLDRGIPPAMIPIVFAGMSGGSLTREMLEAVQQYIPLPQQHHHAQNVAAQAPVSPEHRRDSQQYGYAGTVGVPPTPVAGAPSQPGFVPYQGPGSPTRPRAQFGAPPRPIGALRDSALPRLNIGEGTTGSHPTQQQGASAHQDPSPSIYFHHWQPPTSQSGSSQQATSSVDSPKKRKATGPHQPVPPPSTRRSKSPTFGQYSSTSSFSNVPSSRRRGGHSRQRSDISVYTSASRSRDILGGHRGFSPGVGPATVGTSRETTFAEPSHQPRSSAHSVSSLLSDDPSSRYTSDLRGQRSQVESGPRSRATSEERERGLPPPRERSHE